MNTSSSCLEITLEESNNIISTINILGVGKWRAIKELKFGGVFFSFVFFLNSKAMGTKGNTEKLLK